MLIICKYESRVITRNVYLFLYIIFVVINSETAHKIKYRKSKMIMIYSK